VKFLDYKNQTFELIIQWAIPAICIVGHQTKILSIGYGTPCIEQTSSLYGA